MSAEWYTDDAENQKMYAEYVGAKRDIGEEPFDFDTWLQMERDIARDLHGEPK